MASAIHQITAPRTIQAFIVVLFSVVSCVLVLTGNPIPDLIGWSLAGIIGYYFNADGRDYLNGNGNGNSKGKMLTPPLPSLAYQMANTAPQQRPAQDDVKTRSGEMPLSPYADRAAREETFARVGLVGAFSSVNTLSLPWFG